MSGERLSLKDPARLKGFVFGIQGGPHLVSCLESGVIQHLSIKASKLLLPGVLLMDVVCNVRRLQKAP